MIGQVDSAHPVLEVMGSNLGSKTGYPTEDFNGIT
jgi:hypothetical protein